MKIKKMYLNEAIIFMGDIELDRADSRKRSAFNKRLTSEAKTYAEDESTVKKSFIPKDENDKEIWNIDEKTGKVMTGYFEPTNSEKMNKEIMKLMEEEIVISRTEDNGGTYDRIKEILEEYEGKLSKKAAAIYEILCTGFEITEGVF